MKKYIYQDFLLKCPYTEIIIEEALWHGTDHLQNYKEPYNLFDWINHSKIRSISLSELDYTVDTEEDFTKEVEKLRGLDTLIIRNDRPNISNVYIKSYSDATLKAYIYRFRNAGLQCFVDQVG